MKQSWIPTAPKEEGTNKPSGGILCICLGTGRFLRSVLVPALNDAVPSSPPILIQTRGRSFLEYMNSASSQNDSYEVDTVEEDGTVSTSWVKCGGAFSFGSAEGKESAYEYLKEALSTQSPTQIILGVGVTEAGLSSANTRAMLDLFEAVAWLQHNTTNNDVRISILNTDNVPKNGDRIAGHMKAIASSNENSSIDFSRVFFHNSMVDRIVAHRDNNTMVPRCEPLPAKALVFLDESGSYLSPLSKCKGVVIRTSVEELELDIHLKLCIANGTHTALAHGMALSGHLLTSALSVPNGPGSSLWMPYVDALVQDCILPAVSQEPTAQKEAQLVWEDWRRRLLHPHFGLSTFFITQNGPAKGGIRWGPTVRVLLGNKNKTTSPPVTASMIFAYAALLKWLTACKATSDKFRFVGWLDGKDRHSSSILHPDEDAGSVTYADGLQYNLEQGWYTFKCACETKEDGNVISQSFEDIVADATPQPAAYFDAVKAYLLEQDGGNLKAVAKSEEFPTLVLAISTVLARMVAGDSLESLLKEFASLGWSTPMSELTDGPLAISSTAPLQFRTKTVPNESKLMSAPILTHKQLQSVVVSEVASVKAIDLHTHLLPPSHGPGLCLWGIDELLTYHYLVAEYFMTSTEISPSDFYENLTKPQQANLIWKALFVDRSPISEACRGVLTTLCALGLGKEVASRDLEAIRKFYFDQYRSRGTNGAEDFSRRIYEQAGIRYAIMTNIPFDVHEAQQWRPVKQPYGSNYRSALRVDPLLAGDFHAVEASLQAAGYSTSMEGARQYLRDWCDTMEPEYMMASTPHDFVLRDERSPSGRPSVNPEDLTEPGAFASAGVAAKSACPPGEESTPSLINEDSDLLSEVLMKVCEERGLPLALKIGAHRAVNPFLKSAGDGIAVVDTQVLVRLCRRFPQVKFLATFLSRNHQHEACVLASKFSNLHLYGCWWFCNNPSIIREITSMRVELLGTAFTAQHSDARVLDQLLYKWSHSRAVIAQVLVDEFGKLLDNPGGWRPTRAEIRRDVHRLFGKSYEEFMKKPLKG